MAAAFRGRPYGQGAGSVLVPPGSGSGSPAPDPAEVLGGVGGGEGGEDGGGTGGVAWADRDGVVPCGCRCRWAGRCRFAGCRCRACVGFGFEALGLVTGATATGRGFEGTGAAAGVPDARWPMAAIASTASASAPSPPAARRGQVRGSRGSSRARCSSSSSSNSPANPTTSVSSPASRASLPHRSSSSRHSASDSYPAAAARPAHSSSGGPSPAPPAARRIAASVRCPSRGPTRIGLTAGEPSSGRSRNGRRAGPDSAVAEVAGVDRESRRRYPLGQTAERQRQPRGVGGSRTAGGLPPLDAHAQRRRHAPGTCVPRARRSPAHRRSPSRQARTSA